jgi:hypothetical protein
VLLEVARTKVQVARASSAGALDTITDQALHNHRMATLETSELLEQLRPITKTNVIDLLRNVGHDVSHWSFRADESPVEVPAANGAYCYDWAFGSEREGIVLCVWHRSLQPTAERIEYRENLRKLGDQLSAIAASSERSPTERSRTRQQAARAYQFDGLVRQAYDRMAPVALIVNEGSIADREKLGEGSSHVSKRALDPERWYVHQYDAATGDCLLVRGIKASADVVQAGEDDDDDRGPEDRRQFAAISVRRGQPEFREKLLAAWQRTCAVTGCRIVGLLEAAHISPHSEGTDYRTSNGLLLRADIHTLFDLGLLSIDSHCRVHLADAIQFSEYRQYLGKQIDRLPERSADAPSHEALAKRHSEFLSRRQQ